ncbi:MAG: hypothetical protein ACXWDI_02980 [Nocardioides sp.]
MDPRRGRPARRTRRAHLDHPPPPLTDRDRRPTSRTVRSSGRWHARCPPRLPDEDVDRIRSLVIPPAWQDVWICPPAREV